MTRDEVYDRIECVLKLPLAEQAQCLRLAAEAALPVWAERCRLCGVVDHSHELLETFDRWRNCSAADADLDRVAKSLIETLPKDLRKEEDPAGGYAGWAALGISMIALDQCGDVHRDILYTDVCYAAAAVCRTRGGPVPPAWTDLTAAELEFLAAWWGRCCSQFPELVSIQ